MPALRLWLDECIDIRLAESLRRHGFDVLAAGQEGTGGLQDVQQLEHATRLGRSLVSHNQVHFLRLHRTFEQQGRPHAGIILLPQVLPFARLEARSLLLLDWIATSPPQQSSLVRWTELQQRLIHGFRLPGWDEGRIRLALNWNSP